MTTKGTAAVVEGAGVAAALGADALVADGAILVGARKPAPTPTAVATCGAEELLRDIAGGDSQYAANVGNTVHLSPPAKMDRWLQRGAASHPENQILGIPPFCPPRCNGEKML